MVLNNLFLSIGFITFTILRAQDKIDLPKPSGHYFVGTQAFVWSDQNRVDTISGEHFRKLLVQIWYPAKVKATDRKANYIFNIDTIIGKTLYELYQSVQTNSFDNATPRKGKYPVILFSTGRATGAYSYSTIAEELASHGYIFVGVNSPGSSLVFFPGKFVQPLRKWLPPVSIYTAADSMDKFFSEAVSILSADALFVQEKLAELNSNGTFKGRMDLSRIGMMGHSLGGLAASEACLQSDKCQSLLLVESAQSGNVRKNALTKPIGFIISETDLSYDTAHIYTEILTRLKNPFYFFRVSEAGHNTFTDIPLVRKGLFNYPLDPLKGIQLTRALVLNYFDKTLKKKNVDLDSVSNQYKEVNLKVYH